MFVWKAWHQLRPSPSRTRPCRRGWGRWSSSTPCSPSQLASSTIATHGAPVRFATGDRVGDVVGVAVGDEDVGRLELVGGDRRGRVVAAPGTGRRAPARRRRESSKHDVAEKADLHPVQSSSFGRRSSLSSSASAQPTATPTIMPIRASSASSVRTAVSAPRRLVGRGGLADLAPRAPRRTSRPPRAPRRGSAGASAPPRRPPPPPRGTAPGRSAPRSPRPVAPRQARWHVPCSTG